MSLLCKSTPQTHSDARRPASGNVRPPLVWGPLHWHFGDRGVTVTDSMPTPDTYQGEISEGRQKHFPKCHLPHRCLSSPAPQTSRPRIPLVCHRELASAPGVTAGASGAPSAGRATSQGRSVFRNAALILALSCLAGFRPPAGLPGRAPRCPLPAPPPAQVHLTSHRYRMSSALDTFSQARATTRAPGSAHPEHSNPFCRGGQ